MEEQRFSNREIKLMFDNIKELIGGLRDDINRLTTDFDSRIKKVETKVDGLEAFQTRAMTVWAIVVTAVGFILNKFI